MEKKINPSFEDIVEYHHVPFWLKFTDPAPEILRLLDEEQIRKLAAIQMDMKIEWMKNKLDSKIREMESEVAQMKQAVEYYETALSMIKG